MVTADEVGRVTIFAPLDVAALEQLARLAADVSLRPGEYAANQGDEQRCSPCSTATSRRSS